MASSGQGLRIGIQVLLGIIIVALAYWLYLSITEPWKDVERDRALTERTRERMDDVRVLLIQYERANNRFPGTLDSLMMWVRSDSATTANPDSVLGPDVVLDSLLYSPRTGDRFEYVVNDTGRVGIYFLKDPNSDDQIGSLAPDVTLLNAASWE